ncbi:hypothetical protein EEZ25_24535 [Micromonospora aurantiaca]|nr:hypothetical protein EEZ25_24535 [Micromonospora aurantiaca]
MFPRRSRPTPKPHCLGPRGGPARPTHVRSHPPRRSELGSRAPRRRRAPPSGSNARHRHPLTRRSPRGSPGAATTRAATATQPGCRR